MKGCQAVHPAKGGADAFLDLGCIQCLSPAKNNRGCKRRQKGREMVECGGEEGKE